MNNRKYKHDIQELIIQAESILASDDDPVYLSRVRIALDVLHGKTAKDAANEANLNKRTIERWMHNIDESDVGFESLRLRKSSGRPPKLSFEQKREINKILTETYPFEYKYFNTVYWNRDILASVLTDLYPENKITPRLCRNCLYDNHYSRPLIFPYTTLRKALREINIDAALILLSMIRAGEPQRSVENEYKTLLDAYKNTLQNDDKNYNDDLNENDYWEDDDDDLY